MMRFKVASKRQGRTRTDGPFRGVGAKVRSDKGVDESKKTDDEPLEGNWSSDGPSRVARWKKTWGRESEK